MSARGFLQLSKYSIKTALGYVRFVLILVRYQDF